MPAVGSYGGAVSYERGTPVAFRCRTDMAHIRQSRPDSGNGFQVKVRQTFLIVLSLLEGYQGGREGEGEGGRGKEGGGLVQRGAPFLHVRGGAETLVQLPPRLDAPAKGGGYSSQRQR